MEDDDLDHGITFPSPVSADESLQEERDDESFDRIEPVVILLGWLGCQDKHLSKYCSIYDQRGCITIRYTAPRDTAFFNPNKLKHIACKVLDLLDEYGLTENPILFHIFSNNGSYVYHSITQVLTSGEFQKYQKLRIHGVVVDSAPGKARIINGVKAYGATLKCNTFTKCLMMIGMMFFLLFSFLKAHCLALYDHRKKGDNKHFLYGNMAEDQTRWPQLFMYSKNDAMTKYQDIEEMVSRRRRLGVHVDSISWDDSAHVSHFRMDPKTYTKACWDFLDFCVGGQRSEYDDGDFDE